MPDYFRVGPAIWNRDRTDDQRLMAFYLLTNRHRNTEGLYHLPFAYICEDTGWTLDRVTASVTDLEAEDFINYDHQAKVALLVNAMAWQAPDSPNAAKAAVRRLQGVPATFLRGRFVMLAERHSKQLAEAMRKDMPDWMMSSVPTKLRDRIAPVPDDINEAS